MKRLVPGLVIGALVLSASAVSAQGGTLAAVQERGQLICGVNGGLPGFSVLDEATDQYTGIDADYCRAVAAAVLGDPDHGRVRPARPPTSAPPPSRAARWTSSSATPPDTLESRRAVGQLRAHDLLRRPGHDGPRRPRRDHARGAGRRHDLRHVGHDHGAQPDRPDALPGRRVRARRGRRDRHRLRHVRRRPLRRGHQRPLPARRPPLDLRQPRRRTSSSTSSCPRSRWRRSWPPATTSGATSSSGSCSPRSRPRSWASPRTTSPSSRAARTRSSQRLLGETGELGSLLGLANDFVVDVISAVGNYGEIYDRTFGPGHALDARARPRTSCGPTAASCTRRRSADRASARRTPGPRTARPGVLRIRGAEQAARA